MGGRMSLSWNRMSHNPWNNAHSWLRSFLTNVKVHQNESTSRSFYVIGEHQERRRASLELRCGLRSQANKRSNGAWVLVHPLLHDESRSFGHLDYREKRNSGQKTSTPFY